MPPTTTAPDPANGYPWHDVPRILGSVLYHRIVPGIVRPDEWEDYIQDVYAGMMSRLRGTSGYDSTRSSWAHYVVLVGRSIALNRRRARYDTARARSETIGVTAILDGVVTHCDARDVACYTPPDRTTAVDVLTRLGALGEDARDVAEYVLHGYSVAEYLRDDGRSRKHGHSRLREIRAALAECAAP